MPLMLRFRVPARAPVPFACAGCLAPHAATLAALRPLVPTFLSYLLSFMFIAIYWNNHHHMLQASRQVDGRVLWANMHLLLWFSLVPFVTAWMGHTRFASLPVAAYGFVLLLCGLSYFVLSRMLIAVNGRDSALAKALGADRKAITSLLLYTAAIPIAFIDPRVSGALYVLVAVIWFVPDRRIERTLAEK